MSSFSANLKKIRSWGIKGVRDYALRLLTNRKWRNYFIRQSMQDSGLIPTPGITLIAEFHAKLSICKVMRDFLFRLKDAEIPFQALDIGAVNEVNLPGLDELLTPVSEFRPRKYTHVVDMISSPFPDGLAPHHAHIAFWEFESGILDAFPGLANAKEVIALSDFNFDGFKKMLSPLTSVKKIIYPFRFEKAEDLISRKEIRAKYGFGENDFVVFFNFDYGSCFFRKNPDGVIRAFASAFEKTEEARLVFKTSGASRHKAEHASLKKLAEELGVASRFITVDQYISQNEIYSLTNACDVYLSLHRGEGFGLGIAEAMSLGKPVVVTDYSSTREFCLPENSFLIPCNMLQLRHGEIDYPYYSSVESCADPDIESAAKALKYLFEHPEERKIIGEKGQAFLNSHFSTESFKRSVENFLAEN